MMSQILVRGETLDTRSNLTLERSSVPLQVLAEDSQFS